MRSLLFIKWINDIVNKFMAIHTPGSFYSIPHILKITTKRGKKQNVYFCKLNLDKHWKLPNFVEYIPGKLHRMQAPGDVFGTTALSRLDTNQNVHIATEEKLSLLFRMAGCWDCCFYYKKTSYHQAEKQIKMALWTFVNPSKFISLVKLI